MSPLPTIPGLEALSHQVLVTNNNEHQLPADHPKLIIIYGWGDALPKHVSKYTQGYQKLFPHSRLAVVLSSSFDVLFRHEEQRGDRLEPLLEVISSLQLTEDGPASILMHLMSNTGLTNYGTTVRLFQEKYGYPLPHRLLVLDSTPGTSAMDWGNLRRWSAALAFASYARFPWPFVVTHFMWITALLCNDLYQNVTGRPSAPKFVEKLLNNPTYVTKGSRRLYMYRKEDVVIPWDHIIIHSKLAEQEGYAVDTELFQGSGHVQHIRTSPDQYWKAIENSWNQQAP